MKKLLEIMIIMLFVFISYPYRFKIGSNTISIVDIYLVFIGLVIYVGLLGVLAKRKKIKVDRVIISIFIYMVYIIFTLIYSVNLALSLRHILLLFEGIIIFTLINTYIKTIEDFKLVCKYFIIVGVVSLIISVVYYNFGYSSLQLYTITSESMLRSIQLRLGSPAWGPSNYYASMLIIFIPLFLMKFIDNRKIIWAIVTVLSIIVFLQTWSRGGLISLIVALIVYFQINKRKKNKLKANNFYIALTITILVFITFLFLKLNIELFNFFFLVKDDNARFEILKISFDLIKESPFLGYGIGTTQDLNEYLITGTHNYYVQAILETGVIGFVLFLYMIINLLISSVPRKANDPIINKYKAALLASFIGILINILFQASFEGVVFVWLFWTYISLIYSINKISKKQLLNNKSTV